MSTPTPGPWVVSDFHETRTPGHIKSISQNLWKETANGGYRPTPTVARFDIGIRSKSEEQANARLIAAAPELLEAAEALFVNATPWMLNKTSDSEAGTMLEAAIKKAKGEA